MELDEDAGELRIIITRCPSKGRLIECDHIEPYEAYCDHCDTLYRGTLEALGFEYEVDHSECDKARCERVIRSNRPQNRGAP